MKKKHYAQRQKERIQELENDIEKIIKGDFETIVKYKISTDTKEIFEKMLWQGKPTKI
jgi:DNA modification methylase